jgi:hypothetical protein
MEDNLKFSIEEVLEGSIEFCKQVVEKAEYPKEYKDLICLRRKGHNGRHESMLYEACRLDVLEKMNDE